MPGLSASVFLEPSSVNQVEVVYRDMSLVMVFAQQATLPVGISASLSGPASGSALRMEPLGASTSGRLVGNSVHLGIHSVGDDASAIILLSGSK